MPMNGIQFHPGTPQLVAMPTTANSRNIFRPAPTRQLRSLEVGVGVSRSSTLSKKIEAN